MLLPSGAFYVDLVVEDPLSGSPTPILVNTFPFDTQIGVPAADAGGSHEIHLSVVDITTAGLAAGMTTITVTTTLGTVLVFDGTSFAAGWTGSIFSPLASDGGLTIDEHRFILQRDTPFVSLETVTVAVTAETVIPDALSASYSFVIEDLTKPLLLSAKTRGLTRVRVKFDEAMLQGTEQFGDALFVRSLSAGVRVEPPAGPLPARVILPRAGFSVDDVGLFLGIAGAENGINNGIFEILSFLDDKTVEIDEPLVLAEVLPNVTIITVAPYRLAGVADDRRLLPFFEPLVIGAQRVADDEVELLLHTEVTQNRLYRLYATLVEDLHENVLDPSFVEFTTEACPAPPERSEFNMLRLFPQGDLSLDKSGDLERMLRVYDEVLQLLLCDIDKFPQILDVDLAPESLLDPLLLHLGVPFSFAFSLTEAEKRRLAKQLVPIYKRKGVETAIETTVAFLLGFEIDIQPYLNPGATWVLGDPVLGVLGSTTVLGPGTSFLRFSFQVFAEDDLEEVQRQRLIEIVEYMKPAHTHFVRLIEPSTPTIPVFMIP